MPASSIITLVLAAGESSRMGQSKQLLPVGNKTLLHHAVTTALTVTKTIVILGANSDSHRDAIKDLPAEYIYNTNWHRGMGNSLKVGLAHCIKNNPQIEAVIIMVCDQPLITPQHLEDLITQHNTTNKKIIATEYSHTLGVPVLFKKNIFPEILAIDDTHGAKKIITQHPDNVAAICFPDGAIDIDTAQDYRNLLDNYPT